VIEPLATICRELQDEYSAEYSAREKFLPGTVDGIITGGISDDWRIVRYMHASHAVLRNGLPSRWAGNRVFPNGFMEMKLKRGSKLVVYGESSEAEYFTLICDGENHQARFDSDGKFVLPLKRGKEKVTVRLEKSGSKYPVFYAVTTCME
jgi:hypothetical protein